MKHQAGTKPHWMESAPLPTLPRLERARKADIVVVGAGITGLTTAYLLTRAGRTVAVLERDEAVEHDTAHTSAHLSMVTDAWLSELVDRFGRDHAQAAWDAGLAAIAQIDTIVREEEIACDFAWVPGYLHRPLGDGGPNKVRPTDAFDAFRDEAVLAADLGFDAAFVDDVPFVGGPGVVFEDQARFHPRRYLAGIAKAILAAGGHIYRHSAAEEFCDEPRSVSANGHTITCDEIVLATHTPVMGNTNMASASLFQTKLALYSTYVVGGSRQKRPGARRVVLGYVGSVSLPAHRATPRSRLRHLRRRRSQDRPGGRYHRLLRTARAGRDEVGTRHRVDPQMVGAGH